MLMKSSRSRAHLSVWFFLPWFACVVLNTKPVEAQAQGINVFTRNYNNQRTGANLSETLLNTSNVNRNHFGKLFQLPIDDQVYAGMLYASNVAMAGGTHNVIYVATVNNSMYAFDADVPGPPLWQRNFNNGGRPTKATEVGQNCKPYRDFSGNIGAVSTPVIDASTNTMYFVARTVENGITVQRLRAIDIATGNDRARTPYVVLQANGFEPLIQNQRSGIALSQGVLYVAWASFCDTGPYHGWVMAYDAASFSQLGIFNTTPAGTEAGIWMSGAAPPFDAAGNLYVTTGNGTFDGINNFGESLVKLAPQTLRLVDFFTPSNWHALNIADADLGSSGPIFLPGTSLALTGGKEGKAYLLDTNNLGGVVPGDTQIPLSFQAADLNIVHHGSHHVHNTAVAWNSPAGLNVYISGENDYVKAYRFDPFAGTLNLPPVAVGSFLPPRGMPGSVLTLSANGSQPGSGILWAATPRLGDANQLVVPGVLTAYDAETLDILWTSNGTGDDSFNFAKGSPPLVANGKVYLASLSNIVSVYGLRTGDPASKNLALNKAATGSPSCSADETPNKAVDGSYSRGTGDRWCSMVTPSFLQVDLGGIFHVGQIVILHAGAGGEGGTLDQRERSDFDLNTSAYNLQISADGANFTTVADVTGNILSITTHNLPPTPARFVRLNITVPTRSTDTTSRIYDFQVYAAP